MYSVPQAGLTKAAVAGQLERGVRPHLATARSGVFHGSKQCLWRWRKLGVSIGVDQSLRELPYVLRSDRISLKSGDRGRGKRFGVKV